MKPNIVTIHIDFYISPYVILANHESYEWDDPPSTPRSFMKGATRRRSFRGQRENGRHASESPERHRAEARWDPVGLPGGLYDLGVTDWGLNMGITC